ncbi:MAG TPA: bifunctional UDP-N-acetylglucosamine diphosphorylase/glucosamine-1-phosphate N-acetyltransferase GlmU [Anaerolineales bacterium]|nr:bifunctional UDP-N-acetylglucosamine diphosphorylase/glucosamine-1-phosphate N-acetyltransferase GlmU [Anaerolineales bacterium]
MRCESVILAAGLGTRMKSSRPKVLHPLGGLPLIAYSVDACRQATGSEPIVVIPLDAEEIRRACGPGVEFVEQENPLGTGHALMQAAGRLPGRSELVLATSADMALLRAETLADLVEHGRRHPGPITLLTAISPVSRGFGRLLRSEAGDVVAILEETHADEKQKAIEELNVGAYVFRLDWLREQLPRLPRSAKGEYYLTDLVAIAAKAGEPIEAVQVADLDEIIGINTREHLAEAEAALRRRINRHWLESGVSLQDPATTYIGPRVILGAETFISANTHLEGATSIGEACRLGPNTIVRDSRIGARCEIEMSVLEGAVLEDEVSVGPFAHLRRGAYLCQGVHVGNFGEVKDSRLEAGVKMGHFSYIGDASIGENVNIGAGTITCNFDGERKQRTEIGDGAFIGSDTMLVAPVRVGRGSRTGAGSVVTRDVPDGSVAVGVPARVIRKQEVGKDPHA